MNEQLTINFEEWELPAPGERPLTPASSPDMSSAALRAGLNMIDTNPAREPIFYISFGSGSSGNSCYVGTRRGGIIVDAGVDSDIIVRTLANNGVPMSQVKGLCLTHDHSDHVRYAYKLLRNNKHLKLYCTNRVLNAILRRHNISKRIKDYHTPIFKEFPFKVADFTVTAFDVPHDAADNAGFSIEYGDKRFVMATDLGQVSERARFYMQSANFLMIEANYDLHMLRWGPYPEYLKARIQTEHGHLDNADTARFLAEIVGPHLRYVFLCHLSKDNNTPEKALAAVREAITARGVTIGSCSDTIEDRACDLQLMALPRFNPTRWLCLR
ncbi:MAG: MBL fold metallo-hydrolase [Prevotella sp.]|nr:MBL fold metallo-hydrolase [Prevotella sp.]MCM1074530.1 MBL fold metallo-hydrolase [Ruminococcus sp.]